MTLQTVEHKLTPVEQFALAKASGAAESIKTEISNQVAVGKQSGSITLRLDFELNKAPAYECAPTVDLLSKAVLCRAMVMSGIQAENFMACLKQAALDAYASKEKVAETIAEDERVAKMIDAIAAEVTSQLPKKLKNGACKVKSAITVLGAVETTESAIQQDVSANEKAA